MSKKPYALIIMDGYGLSELTEGNAVAAAGEARSFANWPRAAMHTSGMDVGLPDGQMGNSEVGHTNIGAGRVVYQELTRITKAVRDGDFFENPELLAAAEHCKAHDSALHLMGLLSDGGVHSHNTHLYALLDFAKKQGLTKVYIHCLLDGRDVAPNSGKKFVQELVEKLRSVGVGEIATVIGRYYAMDRDNRWERVRAAYDAIADGEGEYRDSAVTAVERSYNAGILDEFVKPAVITRDGRPIAPLSENDSLVFFNFRPDRAREITRTFVERDFSHFERKRGYIPVKYVCMTQYDETMPNVSVAFTPAGLSGTLGEHISKLGLTQLRIAETEKYAHVTFFFNGGEEAPFEGEDRVLIPSPKVATYDLMPEMSAFEVAEEAVKRIESGKYDLIVLNFANCDMVGHTGVFGAAVEAVKTVNKCVDAVVSAILRMGGAAFVTADHGNADVMVDPDTGGAFTAHTTNVVPAVLIGAEGVSALRTGRLADIAPTILDVMGLPVPPVMTGESLLVR